MDNSNDQIAVRFTLTSDAKDRSVLFMRRFNEFLDRHGLEVTLSMFGGADGRTWQGTLERSGAGEWRALQRLETAVEGFVRLDEDVDDSSFSMRTLQ